MTDSVPKWQTPQEFRYPKVGSCIYCSAVSYEKGATRRLGDEHIIPEGLGGHLLLPEASCKACEAKTSSFEGKCLRGVFGPFRIHLGLPSKRPKDRPTTIPIRINATPENIRLGNIETIEVPAAMYPPMVAILGFGPPRIIRPDLPEGALKLTVHMLRSKKDVDDHLVRIAKKFSVHHVQMINMAVGNNEFMQLIAKIAHSYLVGELGYGGFKPLLNDVIIGNDSFEKYVGAMDTDPPTRSKEPGHSITREIINIGGRLFHFVRVRLFREYGHREYVAVAGEVI